MSRIPATVCQRDTKILKMASGRQLTLKELQEAPTHVAALHNSGSFLSSDVLTYRLRKAIYEYYESVMNSALKDNEFPALLESDSMKADEREFHRHVDDIISYVRDPSGFSVDKETLLYRARCIYRFLADELAADLLPVFRDLVENGRALSDSE